MSRKAKGLDNVIKASEERADFRRGDTVALQAIKPCGLAFFSAAVRHNSRTVQPIKERKGLRDSMATFGIFQDAKGTLTAGFVVGEKVVQDAWITKADRLAEMDARKAFAKELSPEKLARFTEAGYLDESQIIAVPVNGLQRSQVALEMVLDGTPAKGDFMVEIQRFDDERSMLIYSSLLNEIEAKTSVRVTMQDRIPFAEKVYGLLASKKDFLAAFPPGTGPKLWGLLEADSNDPDAKIWERVKAGIGFKLEAGKPVPANMLLISRIPQEIGVVANYSSREKVRGILKASRSASSRSTKTSVFSVDEMMEIGRRTKDESIKFVLWCVLESQRDALAKGLAGIKLAEPYKAKAGYFLSEEAEPEAEPEAKAGGRKAGGRKAGGRKAKPEAEPEAGGQPEAGQPEAEPIGPPEAEIIGVPTEAEMSASEPVPTT